MTLRCGAATLIDMSNDTTTTTFAVVKGRDITVEKIEAYLPRNYSVVGTGTVTDEWGNEDDVVVIEGSDNAGWTFDDYVAPRLASGLWFATRLFPADPVRSAWSLARVTGSRSCTYSDGKVSASFTSTEVTS